MSFNRGRACSRLDLPSLLHASGSHKLGEMELTQEPWGRLMPPSHCGSDASHCDKLHRRGPWTSHLLAWLLCKQASKQSNPMGAPKREKETKKQSKIRTQNSSQSHSIFANKNWPVLKDVKGDKWPEVSLAAHASTSTSVAAAAAGAIIFLSFLPSKLARTEPDFQSLSSSW